MAAIYDHMQLGKTWNIPRKHINAVTVVAACDNCGDPSHPTPSLGAVKEGAVVGTKVSLWHQLIQNSTNRLIVKRTKLDPYQFTLVP